MLGFSSFRPDKEPEIRQNQSHPRTLFSVLFVTISYISLMHPLAVYQAAQLTSFENKKKAFLILSGTSLGLIALGSVLGGVFIESGILGLLTAPLYMWAVSEREKKKPWIRSVLILMIPFFVFMMSLFTIPQVAKNELEKVYRDFQSLFTEQLEKSSAEADTKATRKMEFERQLQTFEQSPLKEDLMNFVSSYPYERLSWFVFGQGSLFLFLLILICICNILFLDLGFENSDKLKAAFRYLMTRKELLSTSSILSQFFKIESFYFHKIIRESDPSIIVLTHEITISQEIPTKELFWKPLRKIKNLDLYGVLFFLHDESPWQLKKKRLPLFLTLLSVAGLVGILMYGQSVDNIIALAKSSPQHGFFVSFGGLFAFFVLTILTVRGILILYLKTISLIVFLLALMIWILASAIQGTNIYFFMSVFGAIGLLDHLYDWLDSQKKERVSL